jgi:hypothetical protein
MPLIFGTATTSGTGQTNPFVKDQGVPAQVTVDLSTLTAGATGEVDSNGWLKAGVPFKLASGKLTLVTTGTFVYAVNPEPIPLNVTGLNKGTVTTTTLGNETVDHAIGVVCSGVVNRDIIEDNLGRALNSDEIAGFTVAGSLLRLTET